MQGPAPPRVAIMPAAGDWHTTRSFGCFLHRGGRALDRAGGRSVQEREPPASRSPDGGLPARRRIASGGSLGRSATAALPTCSSRLSHHAWPSRRSARRFRSRSRSSRPTGGRMRRRRRPRRRTRRSPQGRELRTRSLRLARRPDVSRPRRGRPRLPARTPGRAGPGAGGCRPSRPRPSCPSPPRLPA